MPEPVQAPVTRKALQEWLLKAVPENEYVGTVLSPHVLIRASYQSRQIRDQFLCYDGYTSLTEYCEKLHLPQPDMSGIASDQQEGSAAPQMTTLL